MKKIFRFLFLSILIPYFIVTFFVNPTFQNPFFFERNEVVRVKRTSGNIEEVPFEEYIMGVLAGEMPLSFDLEALKAQAVAARSYAMNKILNSKNSSYDILDTPQNQVYLSKEDLKKAWGSDYDARIKKLEQAVLETSHEYLSYDGKIVEAFFFSTSTGMTENSGEIFQKQLPYLVSVKSEWDEEVSPVFIENVTFSIDDFYQKLDVPNTGEIHYEVLETTSTGRIRKININGVTFTGNEIANLLDLRSSYFSITQEGDIVKVTTKGYGHGVGMSQYGALAMAKKGYPYDEILKYYYQGVEIKKF